MPSLSKLTELVVEDGTASGVHEASKSIKSVNRIRINSCKLESISNYFI